MLALTFIIDDDEGDAMTTCFQCRGNGFAGGWEPQPGLLVPTCLRCLGAGRVNNARLAHALEAFRWLRERGRERDALTSMLALIDSRSAARPTHPGLNSVVMRRVFIDVDLMRDTLDEASAGGVLLAGGPAAWVADRWAGAVVIADDYTDPARRSHFQRAHVAFWREVCPAVVEFVTVDPELPLDDPRAPLLPGVA